MISIAIDGPSGAGKSTIARMVAGRLGYLYVDTGALYRTIALFFLRHGVDVEDGAAVGQALGQIQVELRYRDGEQQVFLNGENVNGEIRGDDISQMAADNVVMDGRDIGTVVLPEAQVKIYLTASAVQRAKRRCDEYRAKGIACDYEELLNSVMERDLKDTTRAISPLRQAEDAELIDTTYNTLEESVNLITDYVTRKIASLG